MLRSILSISFLPPFSSTTSRRCYDFLDLLLQEWQTHSLERWDRDPLAQETLIYECSDLLLHFLGEGLTRSLPLSCGRHTAVLVESIKKGIRDADSEARVEARK